MAEQPSNSADLSALATWWRNNWKLVTGTMLGGLLLGVLALFLLPKSYESTSAVLVSPPTDSAGAGALNMDTEIQLVKSATVAQLAAVRLGEPGNGAEVLDSLTLFVPPNSTVIQITYTADTPEKAQAGATAVTDAYLRAKTAAERARIAEQTATLLRQKQRLTNEAKATRQKLDAAVPGSPAAQQLQIDLDSTLRRNSVVNTQLATLQTASIDPGYVITQAQLPTSPSKPDRTTVLASALLLGLLVGLALALFRTLQRNRRIHSLEQLVQLPRVHHAIDLRDVTPKSDPAKLSTPSQRAIERALAWSVPNVGRSGSLILVTSLTNLSRRNKGPVAAAVAVTGSRPEKPALLLLRDTGSTLLEQVVGMPPKLTDPVGDDGIRGGVDVAGARLFVTADNTTQTALAWDSNIHDTLKTLSDHTLVVVELRSVAESMDTLALAAGADAIMFAVAEGDDSRSVADTLEQALPSGASSVIAVLTRPQDPGTASRATTGVSAGRSGN